MYLKYDQILQFFFHLLNDYFLSIYYEPGTKLVIGESAVNKLDKFFLLIQILKRLKKKYLNVTEEQICLA